MPITEARLKEQLKNRDFERVYFLYGEESYLTLHYANRLAQSVSDDQSLSGFNYQKLDGQTCSISEIIEAVEALPVMAEQKCVTVRDLDVAKLNKEDFNQLKELIKDVPQSCVLVFWTDAVQFDTKKSNWSAFLKAVDTAGASVEFPRKSDSEIVRMLVDGAAQRGSKLSNSNARLIIRQCGNDLNLLIGEMDKLCALAGKGEITPEFIEAVGVKSLEASVYKLSDAILQGSYERAYDIINTLFTSREDPINILAALSGAYADLYRAKVALTCGVRPETLTHDFDYRGKEFRLKNAARDCAKLPLPVLRKSLELLADADRSLKTSSMDERTVLERTIARLILVKRGVTA